MTCTVAIPISQVNIALAIARKFHVSVDIIYEDDLYSHLELIGSRKNIEKVLDNLYML